MEFFLGHENITRGTIRKLKCHHCDFECDYFSIIGDTEAMNFLGVIGLTNLHAKEIFITHLTRNEFQEYKTLDSKTVSNRLEKLLNRNNLLYFKKKVNDQGQLYYPCPKCEAELSIINETTISEYVEQSGKIYTIGNYPNS